jgi:hypothetical protein
MGVKVDQAGPIGRRSTHMHVALPAKSSPAQSNTMIKNREQINVRAFVGIASVRAVCGSRMRAVYAISVGPDDAASKSRKAVIAMALRTR